MLTIDTLALEAESAENAAFPALYLLLCDGNVLCHPERLMAWLDESYLEGTALDSRLRIGVVNGSHTAYVLTLETPEQLPIALHQLEWMPPRALFRNLQGMDFDALSRALQLSNWAKEHRYCGHCGNPTKIHPSEPAQHCESCNALYFPRISPCIIVLITRGEYCLLAHHTRYAQSFYSTLAGFVEAGESLEQALHREIREEVNLKVDNLEYFGSQSWPFPGQLMVGYIVSYHSGDIKIDETEISDARWFHYTDLPDTPTRVSISGQLIAEFVARCEHNAIPATD
ncbi:MAG: NAD(+) diphosphatase [Oceanospirillaceae bacterium]|nr:NAD(+) diphosphatase [Oceanospirillaceae bacterium]|tara:strand:- start:728 stop:1582 length:855 start_codon:yes stop_codon:yes gene_type:complete